MEYLKINIQEKITRAKNIKKFNERLNEKWLQNENIQINYTQTKKVPTASLSIKLIIPRLKKFQQLL